MSEPAPDDQTADDLGYGARRVREVEARLAAVLARLGGRIVGRRWGAFELEGGATIRVESAAGAAFLCVETPAGAPLQSHWIPTEISRCRDEALTAVVEDALAYVRDALTFKPS